MTQLNVTPYVRPTFREALSPPLKFDRTMEFAIRVGIDNYRRQTDDPLPVRIKYVNQITPRQLRHFGLPSDPIALKPFEKALLIAVGKKKNNETPQERAALNQVLDAVVQAESDIERSFYRVV
jgi:hypothetical protein